MTWLINTVQLEKFRKSQKSVLILDASAHMPSENRHALGEFEESHIAGAQFFDIRAFDDASADAPHMLLLDEGVVSEKLSAMGIRDDYKIIFYDNSSLHSACRALWMFRVFGHNPHQLYVLDGGFAAWKVAGGKLESGSPTVTRKQYTAKMQLNLLRNLAQMKANVQDPTEQVIDVRHPVRFAGGAEPRPGLRAGHIPGSFCFPYSSLFDKEGYFLPLDKIRRLLTELGVDLQSPIVTTCGSGTTAPILNFILDLMNHPQQALYDGSWSEWGAENCYPGEASIDERPVETCLEN